MANSSRNLTLLLVVLTIIILGGGGYFAYDQYNSLQAKRAELEVRNKEKEQKQQELENLKQLASEYAKIESEAVKVNDALPSKENLPELLYELEAIARKEAGVLFQGVSFSEVKDQKAAAASVAASKTGLQKIALNIKIKGTYQGLKKYLSAVEKNIRLFEVASINFSAKSAVTKTSVPDVNEYEISLITYYLNQ